MSVFSLIPTSEAKAKHEAKRAEKKAQKEKWASSPYDNEMTAEEQWQHMWELQQLPRTPGTAGGLKSPTTPRTMAYNNLGGEHQGYASPNGYAPANPPANGWYGRSTDIEAVSPIEEPDEFIQQNGKGKGAAGAGTAY